MQNSNSNNTQNDNNTNYISPYSNLYSTNTLIQTNTGNISHPPINISVSDLKSSPQTLSNEVYTIEDIKERIIHPDDKEFRITNKTGFIKKEEDLKSQYIFLSWKKPDIINTDIRKQMEWINRMNIFVTVLFLTAFPLIIYRKIKQGVNFGKRRLVLWVYAISSLAAQWSLAYLIQFAMIRKSYDILFKGFKQRDIENYLNNIEHTFKLKI
jgi:hypothetical protein